MKALIALLLTPLLLPAAAPKDYFVYVGTYTRTLSKGIYAYRFTPSTGGLVPLGLVAETAHPSYLVVHPNGRFLYSVNEHEGANEPGNTVTAWARDKSTGKLTFLNRVSSKGVGPCYLAIDKSGKILVTANYGSGSVATFPILPDGRVGEAAAFIQHQGSGVDPVRQTGPHAHSAVISPDKRFVLAADLGLDKIFIYRLNAKTGALEPNATPSVSVSPGWGARHL